MADAADLKSAAREGVRVRIPPPVRTSDLQRGRKVWGLGWAPSARHIWRDLESARVVIVRVLRATVAARNVAAFDSRFRGQVDLLREQPGLVYVKLARRLRKDGSEEVVLFEDWRDPASLYAWVGPNLDEPRLVPGTRELIDSIEVAHYEALDVDVSDAASAPPTDAAPPGPSSS